STESHQPSSRSEAPRSSHARRNRRRICSINRFRSEHRSSHSSASLTGCMPRNPAPLSISDSPSNLPSSRADQVGPCTPLVTERIGTSSTPNPGHKWRNRSEEHTSELQSRENLVCRLLLEKKTRVFAE